MDYTILIHKDEDSGWYTGKCIQVPAAMSQGKTIAELMENMRDAISLVLECYKNQTKSEHSGERIFYRKLAMA